ncbi:MAG: sugar transferase [Anaerolineaceae bacterium]|nr:MAG: sugar transferase [Anaerolineaceae bacterium]
MNYIKVKRGIDLVLSFLGLVVLSPIFVILTIGIKLDSKGPVLFSQKRIGIHKTQFNILKFRTMRIDTPKDIPTHLLKNPDQYITKMGKFLRKTSLDELPQIWNIFIGKMSIIGPRPALWNQYDLIEEREKYGANDIRPGLTGLAQIRGRDELSIEDKASIDGEYVTGIGMRMDLNCFIGTIISVIKHDGVVEGGTGSLLSMQEVASTYEGGIVEIQNGKEINTE